MFNFSSNSKYMIAKIMASKSKATSNSVKYVITCATTFEELRKTRYFRAAYNNSGVAIPTVCDLKVIIDNDLEYGEVEVR